MRMVLKFAAAAALLAVTGSAPVQAGGPLDEIFEIGRACQADYDRFCPDVPPGHGRIKACLGRYKYELSPPCYKAFTVATAISACTPDYYRLCEDTPPGNGRALECLSANAPDLSEHCSQALAAATAEFGHLSTSKRGYYEPEDDENGRDHYRYERRYYSERYERRDGRYAEPEPEREPLK